MNPSHPLRRLALAALLVLLAPAVKLNAQTPAPTETEVEMTQISEGGKHYVPMQDFLKAIQTFDPQARGFYDPRSQILRIQTGGGKQFDILERQASVIINRRLDRVEDPLIRREGRVLVPVPTVRKIFSELNISVTEDKPAAAPAGTPIVTPPPVVPSVPSLPVPALPVRTPLAPATPTTSTATTTQAATTPTTAAVVPETTLEPTPAATRRPVTIMPSRPTPRPATPPTDSEAALQPPQALAGSIGLSWAQLADLSHRQPPSRVTIVCDSLLKGVADQVCSDLRERLQVEGAVVPVPSGQRAQDALVMQVDQQAPQLVIDLTASRINSDKFEGANSYSIWVVNSSLWPGQKDSDPEPLARRYQIHEFQSLALGSLLRTELGRQFPDQTITYGLAPSYLLRRVNAPSAAMLVPLTRKQEAVEPERAERIATAVSAAVVAYIHGMSQVGF